MLIDHATSIGFSSTAVPLQFTLLCQSLFFEDPQIIFCFNTIGRTGAPMERVDIVRESEKKKNLSSIQFESKRKKPEMSESSAPAPIDLNSLWVESKNADGRVSRSTSFFSGRFVSSSGLFLQREDSPIDVDETRRTTRDDAKRTRSISRRTERNE